MSKVRIIAIILLLSGLAAAQKPVAQLPRIYIDSTWNSPIGGTTWAAHTSAQLSSALTHSSPGDVIALDVGVTYVGNFILPAKANSNNKWTYIISSALAKIPAGTRVLPTNAASMPKIVTPNVAPAFQINGGANHWRLAGLEITSASTSGCQPTHNPPINCFSYFLIGPQSGVTPEPDSFTIDRCYVHGSPTIDLQRAILANASNFAVVDSYISDVHMTGVETQGIASWWTPGPLKIVNNYISASTENILIGGAGGPATPWVPSDLEIRNNYIFKPLSWVVNSCCAVKNAFEVKSAQRVLFDSNTIENVWANAQNGFAIVLTVRTSQSGDIAVVNDITVTNNILKNVVAGFNTLAKDDTCGAATGYPNCHNAGSEARIYIANNLMTFYNPALPGGLRNEAWQIADGMDRINGNVQGVPSNIVFQHNTMISAASKPCWASIGFTSSAFPSHTTNNIWILDNVMCTQPSGDWGQQGTSGLTAYMGDPSTPPHDLTQRFYGNVIYVAPGIKVWPFPPHNYATTVPFTFVNPGALNYQLLTPFWTNTTDGTLAGIDFASLSRALATSGPVSKSTVITPAVAATSSPVLSNTTVSSKPALVAIVH
jgi:hypothetical protein